MASVTLQPTIEKTPWEKYQMAIANYQAKNPQAVTGNAPMYTQPGVPQPAGDPFADATKVAASIALKKQLAASGAAALPETAPILNGATSYGGFAGPGAAAPVATQTAAPTILGNAAGMGAGPLAAIGVGTYLGGEAAYDMLKGRKPGLPGRIVLGMATGGLSELAPSLFGHKSTKEYQQDKWGGFAKSNYAPTAAYGKQYLDYLGSDRAKTDALYQNTLEGKKAAGTLKAEDVWGGAGMFDTFGNDWLGKYTEDQRRAISTSLLANDLIKTSKGDQYITDQTKAKELAASSIASLLAKPANNGNSPGFKDGKRINYGAKK
jgi:hypothetical protein